MNGANAPPALGFIMFGIMTMLLSILFVWMLYMNSSHQAAKRGSDKFYFKPPRIIKNWLILTLLMIILQVVFFDVYRKLLSFSEDSGNLLGIWIFCHMFTLYYQSVFVAYAFTHADNKAIPKLEEQKDEGGEKRNS